MLLLAIVHFFRAGRAVNTLIGIESIVGTSQVGQKMIENSLRDNAKIVITEHGISPTLLLGSLPITVSSEKNGRPVTLHSPQQ